MMILRGLRSSIAIFAVRGVVVLMNFLSLLLVAHMLGVSSYGRFVLVWSGALVIASVLSLGAPTYLMREMSVSKISDGKGVTYGEALWLALIFPALIALMLGALLRVMEISNWMLLPPQVMHAGLWILALGWLLNLNANMASAIHAQGGVGISMFQRDAMPQCFSIVAATIAVASGRPSVDDELVIVTLGWLFSLMTGWCFLVGIVIFARNRRYPVFGVSARKYTFSFWGSSILGALWAQVDVLVGSLFLTPAQLGTYNILRRVANLAALPIVISSWVTVGDFSRAFFLNDVAALQSTNRRATLLSVLPGSLLILSGLALYPLLGLMYDGINSSGTPGLFLCYLLLLGQSAVFLIFASGMTVASTSGMEASAMRARVIGILGYLLVLILALAVQVPPLFANGLAVMGGSITMSGTLWLKIWRRTRLDTSAFSLLISR